MEKRVEIYSENVSNTVIYSTDEPSENNNANHEFVVSAELRSGEIDLQKISLQHGPIKENGHNGIFMEHLIAICIDTLGKFQTSKYNCRENAIAKTKLEEAMMWLNKRTQNRVKRGVEGTNIV